MNRSETVRRLVVLAMFVAMIMVLALPGSPLAPILGFINIGAFAITTIHIVVILGAVLEGPVAGLILGLAFGACSLYTAFVNPTITSPAFQNPLVSVLPRILIGVVAAYVYRGLFRLFPRANSVAAAITGAVGTLTNTAGVFGMILLCAQLIDGYSAIVAIMIPALLTNTLPEVAAAVVITTLLTIPMRGMYRRLGWRLVNEKQKTDKGV